VTTGATPIVASRLRDPFEAARDRTARRFARVQFADQDSPTRHAADRATEQLVLVGQRQVVQNVDQEQRVHFTLGESEQVLRLESRALGSGVFGNGQLARVRVETKELARAAQLPQK